MSLYLGNISPRIRKDELERAFRRFGRCTLQVKDGYGFAVYDFRGDAEKALRALKGRRICGEAIFISWSNKQPKSQQRFARANRAPDMQYGRNPNKVDNYVGRCDFSRSHTNHPMTNKRLEMGRGSHKSEDALDDKATIKGKKDFEHFNRKEEFSEEGDHIRPNQLDTDRWGEEIDGLQYDNGIDQEMGFDRYEPDCVDERGEEYENYATGHLADSPSVQTSLDKDRVVHRPDKKKADQTCFKCGAAGHKIRDCQLEGAFHGRKSYQSDHRHEKGTKNRMRSEVGGPDSRSRESLSSSGRNHRLARQPGADRKAHHSENRTKGRSSLLDNESNRTKREPNRKRQREEGDEIVGTLGGRSSKRGASLHLRSPKVDKHSKSLNPLPGSGSQTRSESPALHSLPASSRSTSRLNHSRSRSIKSKSRSRSSSPSSSLSVSRSQSFPPNKEDIDINGSLDDLPSPQSKEVLTEARQDVEPGTRENFSIVNTAEASLSGHIDNAMSDQIKKVSVQTQELKRNTTDENLTSTDFKKASLNSSLEDNRIPESESEREYFEPQIFDMPPRTEDVSSSVKVRDGMKMDLVHDDENNSVSQSHVSREPSLLDLGNKEELREAEELESAEAPEMIKSVRPASKSDATDPSTTHSGRHLDISTEELQRVLKHYGLKHSEKNEQVGVEDYFGSARLWPWEMIYYRRLKKGPISKENYARRVAQNKAFSITDKYIRSSSGWGEPNEESLFH